MNKIKPVSVNSVYSDFLNQPKRNISSSSGVTSSSSAATNPVASTPVQSPVPQVSADIKEESNQNTIYGDKSQEEKFSDKLLKYSGLISLAAIPAVGALAYVTSGKSFLNALNKASVNTNDVNRVIAQNAQTLQQNAKILDQVTDLLGKVGTETTDALHKNDNAVWTAIAALAGGAASGAAAYKLSEGKGLSEGEKGVIAREAADRTSQVKYDLEIAKQSGTSALNAKVLREVHGFDLVSQVDFKKTNSQKYSAALDEVRAAANKYLDGVEPSKLAPGSNVWSITAEFDPIKEGGLGSVPPEIQSNFTKMGIKCPTFVPMYDVLGKSQINLGPHDNYQSGTYTFGDTTFNIERAAAFKVNKTRKDGNIKDWQRIEIYVSTQKTKNGKTEEIPPLVFIKSNNYFTSLPYTSAGNMGETERFAFFSKIIYEFEKAVFDPKSVSEFSISNQEAFDKIGKPDAMLLNDWHAGAVAALSRYKAPCENASNIISDEVKDKIAKMNMTIICHNAQHQGSTIMNNDNVQRKESSENILNTLFDDYTADIVEAASSGAPYSGISNVLVLEKDDPWKRNINLLNMGICLSNVDAPVSENYAKELRDDIERSGCLQWALQQKNQGGYHIGIINGNDYSNINQVKMAEKMHNMTGVDFVTYGRDNSIDEILEARKENKIRFYNDFIRKIANNTLDKKYSRNAENVGATVPPALSDEEIANTPFLVSTGRLVSQKGVKALCESIEKLYKNWDKEHPGQNKPIVYISGADGENGAQRPFVDELKNKLSDEDKNRVIFYHGFAPSPAYMMCSDFFLMPSVFEPCGLTQGESLAQGTPVIATAVGGLVDTIKTGKEDGYGILTKGELDPSAEDKDSKNANAFLGAMNEGLDIYFNDKPRYERMVQNAINFDQSWAQPGKKGPIYQYAESLGFNVGDLPDIAADRA